MKISGGGKKGTFFWDKQCMMIERRVRVTGKRQTGHSKGKGEGKNAVDSADARSVGPALVLVHMRVVGRLPREKDKERRYLQCRR